MSFRAGIASYSPGTQCRARSPTLSMKPQVRVSSASSRCLAIKQNVPKAAPHIAGVPRSVSPGRASDAGAQGSAGVAYRSAMPPPTVRPTLSRQLGTPASPAHRATLGSTSVSVKKRLQPGTTSVPVPSKAGAARPTSPDLLSRSNATFKLLPPSTGPSNPGSTCKAPVLKRSPSPTAVPVQVEVYKASTSETTETYGDEARPANAEVLPCDQKQSQSKAPLTASSPAQTSPQKTGTSETTEKCSEEALSANSEMLPCDQKGSQSKAPLTASSSPQMSPQQLLTPASTRLSSPGSTLGASVRKTSPSKIMEALRYTGSGGISSSPRQESQSANPKIVPSNSEKREHCNQRHSTVSSSRETSLGSSVTPRDAGSSSSGSTLEAPVRKPSEKAWLTDREGPLPSRSKSRNCRNALSSASSRETSPASSATRPSSRADSPRTSEASVHKRSPSKLLQALRQAGIVQQPLSVGPAQLGDFEGHLGFEEFKHALSKELCKRGIALPSAHQFGALFLKYDDGEGVATKEFKALVELLCFMPECDKEDAVSTPSQDVVSRPLQPVRASASQHSELDDNHSQKDSLPERPRSFADMYEITAQLGRGKFGTVFEVEHKAWQERGGKSQKQKHGRVCKIVQKADALNAGDSLYKAQKELDVLRHLDHPHIIRIYENFEDDTKFVLIMEACEGGNLKSFMQGLPKTHAATYERWTARVLQQSLAALAHCHHRGVIHKDMKPENVLLLSRPKDCTEDVHVVVADFGLADILCSSEARSNVMSGTPHYMAPEVWLHNVGASCDVWSCGVMLFFMLAGAQPFDAPSVPQIAQRIATVEPDWGLMGNASQEAHMLCQQMLSKSEGQRPSAAQALRQSWFFEHGLLQEQQKALQSAGLEALAASVLDKFRKLHLRSDLAKFVARLLAPELRASERVAASEAFRALDTTGRGLISRGELQSWLTSMGGSDEDADHAINEINVSRTGMISYTEFLAAFLDFTTTTSEEQEEMMWVAWQTFHPDRNGRAKTNDIQDALEARGMTGVDIPGKLLAALALQQSNPDWKGRVKQTDIQDALAEKGLKKLDVVPDFVSTLESEPAGYLTFSWFKHYVIGEGWTVM